LEVASSKDQNFGSAKEIALAIAEYRWLARDSLTPLPRLTWSNNLTSVCKFLTMRGVDCWLMAQEQSALEKGCSESYLQKENIR